MASWYKLPFLPSFFRSLPLPTQATKSAVLRVVTQRSSPRTALLWGEALRDDLKFDTGI